MLLMFEVADELMDGVERAFGAYFVDDIIEWLITEPQHPCPQMDGLSTCAISITDKLGVKTIQGVSQAWVRGFGMDNNYFPNRETTLQKKIKCKGYDLGLPAQCCK
jgi:hypothetical protein